MAFGFPPKYVEHFPYDGLTPSQFLVVAVEAAKKLNFEIGTITDSGFIAYRKISWSTWGEEVKVIVDRAYATVKSKTIGSQLFDWGKNKKNVQSLTEAIDSLKSSYNNEDFFNKYQELKQGMVSGEEHGFGANAHTHEEGISSLASIFIPREGFIVTPLIIDINILVFLIMVACGVNFLQPTSESLITWGANFRPYTLNGGWWRLITSCFLHIGVLHLLLNMYALLYIGLLLEPRLGTARFLAAYMLTGLAGSVTSLYWHDLTVAAGASGAIFGMYGVFLAMLTTDLIEKTARKTLLTSIGVFVVYNLMNGVKGGIDNAAHIGGLCSGLIIGYAFIPGLKRPAANGLKYASIAGLTVLILAASFTVYKKIPDDIVQYEEKIKIFGTNEEKAVEVLRIIQVTPKEKLLPMIKDTGIYYWNQNLNLLLDLQKLNLPPSIHAKNKTLIDYCNLRLRSYALLYKSVEENTNIYSDSLKIYTQNIEGLIDSLKKE